LSYLLLSFPSIPLLFPKEFFLFSSSSLLISLFLDKMTSPQSASEATKPTEQSGQQHIDLNGRVFELPDFTMKQIHDAIPAHCFKPSVVRSMAYVVRDYFYVSVLIYATTFIPMLSQTWARGLAYAAYTVLQGMVMTGIWILAHECGHGAFTKNKKLNNIMGLIMHSFLLVPYHSWRISHSAHHKATGNMEKDTAFVPWHREQWVKHKFGAEAEPDHVDFAHLSEDAPIVTLWHCIIHQVFGWPGYLFFHITGQKYEVGVPQISHFYFGKDSPLFKEDQLPLIVLSDIGVGTMLAILGVCVHFFGWFNVAILYLIPYLWVNHWIGESSIPYHSDP
jgi:omega-6 fatty acid desaturase (delta-12 desaturase)